MLRHEAESEDLFTEKVQKSFKTNDIQNIENTNKYNIPHEMSQ
jgi:hypothetical protein